MIQGHVNAELEAELPLTVIRPHGSQQRVQFQVDTGYNGFLTLPKAIVDLLSLDWQGRERAVLADRSTVYFDVYRGIVLWNGIPRIIELESSDGTLLLGTSLLKSHNVVLEFVMGGQVTITPLS